MSDKDRVVCHLSLLIFGPYLVLCRAGLVRDFYLTCRVGGFWIGLVFFVLGWVFSGCVGFTSKVLRQKSRSVSYCGSKITLHAHSLNWADWIRPDRIGLNRSVPINPVYLGALSFLSDPRMGFSTPAGAGLVVGRCDWLYRQLLQYAMHDDRGAKKKGTQRIILWRPVYQPAIHYTVVTRSLSIIHRAASDGIIINSNADRMAANVY